MLKLGCTCSDTIIEVRQLKKNCIVPSKSTENCVPKMVIIRQRMTPQERLRAIGMIQAALSHRQVAVTLEPLTVFGIGIFRQEPPQTGCVLGDTV